MSRFGNQLTDPSAPLIILTRPHFRSHDVDPRGRAAPLSRSNPRPRGSPPFSPELPRARPGPHVSGSNDTRGIAERGFAMTQSTTGTGKYEALLERCRSLAPVPTAVVYPCEASAIAG